MLLYIRQIIKFAFLVLLILVTPFVWASDSQTFQIQHPDYKTSPKSGVVREHWVDAAEYLLKGAFSYVHSPNDAMKFPKQHAITYPRDSSQLKTEMLEGLSRTLFAAAPLLKEKPGLVLNGITVADYYRNQLCNLFRENSSTYIKHRLPKQGPMQNLVEFGAIAISLTVAPEILWDPLPKAQKDSLASLMLSYGDGPTISSNWRFFNIYVLSFFKSKGYTVNDSLLLQYLNLSLNDYRGDGWYNDNPAYDYYSMWAYQMYGILWAQYYGNLFPEKAAELKKNFNEMTDNYPYMFARNGKMNMWGRSISYRFAAASVFPLMAFSDKKDINWGWMRRIASSTLMQFLTHPDFMQQNVPTLGFYGPFEPAVQMYSCRGSVYWSAKIFLGLLVPQNHPFWTACENEGPWENDLKQDKSYSKFQNGSNLLITNYPAIGASEMRSWCHETVAKDWQKFRSTENYNRLSYNTAFPWQADGKNGEVAMNYVVKNSKDQWEALRLFTFKKYEDGIYYRDAELETNRNVKFQLAEIPLADGILRVDKIFVTGDTNTSKIYFRLGHYALPQFGKPIVQKTIRLKKQKALLIDNGNYQHALILWNNWGVGEFVHAQGLHPESLKSVVLNAQSEVSAGKNNFKICISLMVWKKSGDLWSKKTILPVEKIIQSENGQQINIYFKDKSVKTIRF